MKLRELALIAGIGTFAHALVLAATVFAARWIWIHRSFASKRGPVEIGLLQFSDILQYPGTWLLPADPVAPPSELLFFSCLALNSIFWGLCVAALVYAWSRLRNRPRADG